MLEQAFLDGVPVEPGDRAQPAGDSGPGPAAGLQVAGETLDVGSAGLEQVQVVQLAPGSELPQVRRVGLPRQAGIAGQESCQHQPLLGGEYRIGDGDRGGRGRCGGGNRGTSRPGWNRGAGPAKAPATMIHPTVDSPWRSRKVAAAFLTVSPGTAIRDS